FRVAHLELRERDAAARERVAQPLDNRLGFGTQAVVGADLQHHVHAALEIEAEVHPLEIERPGREGDDADDESDLPENVLTHDWLAVERGSCPWSRTIALRDSRMRTLSAICSCTACSPSSVMLP